MIMYGISQVFRQDSRLTTGPGDLKSIWILVPVAVRFPGCYRVVSEHEVRMVGPIEKDGLIEVIVGQAQ